MLYIAETKEEAMIEMAKLCFRPSDNSIGRSIKLTHYCDISMKYCGKLPDDWHIYVRDTKTFPSFIRSDDEGVGSKHGWQIDGRPRSSFLDAQTGGCELRPDEPPTQIRTKSEARRR